MLLVSLVSNGMWCANYISDVGIVPEVFGDKQKQFILKERSECIKEASTISEFMLLNITEPSPPMNGKVINESQLQ
ncbi:hypothetical protein LGK95_01530 [Clostridium algoriphilum]|uniref:hypothetical protein n=1 Tax=Clostridium algoriphilum TaxID=198347 RepID=UPI001CF44A71|nr:hypothetical protein [Clostridium algoriphilum]MCB2292218.1 hypothetical protein [Clostridium algoriphilum]